MLKSSDVRSPLPLLYSRVAEEVCGERGDDTLQDAGEAGGEGVAERGRAVQEAGGSHEKGLRGGEEKEISSG